MVENGYKVSVVIAVKNDARRLQVLLSSLAKLPEHPQIIVVDNGSTDDSVSVAESAGVDVYCYPNLRVGALRNRGVTHSNGDVLAFADSDHEVPEDWLRIGCDILTRSEEIVAVGSHYLPPSDGTWVQRVWGVHRLRGETPRDVDWLGAGNLFVRRVDFARVGGFREDLVAAEDVDLCFRLKQQGKRIVCDHSIRSVHHGEPKTIRQFLRKEYWRGSSGIRAWVSQGFPLRDLPSLVWPAWHLLLGIAFLSSLLLLLIHPGHFRFYASLVTGFLWLAPSGLLAARTSSRTGRWGSVVSLWSLYFCYGMARAAALFKR
jgi:glycosyltransferase involved in cell wall biosynthesis